MAEESFADLQRALQRRARRRLFIQHVIRHAQMKLNLRLIRQLRRSFFQQAQRHGISAALQTDPAQRVRRGGIERQQLTRALGQFVGAVELAQIFGIQIRQVVEGRTELWIYQQNFLIRRRRAWVILVRAMNGGGQHQRRDGLRGKRDGRVQFGQRLLVFPGIEIHLRQQPISARIFWLQLNGFQQRGFGLGGIALRHKNFGDQQIQLALFRPSGQFPVHPLQRRVKLFCGHVQIHQLLQRGQVFRRNLQRPAEGLPRRAIVLQLKIHRPHQQRKLHIGGK